MSSTGQSGIRSKVVKPPIICIYHTIILDCHLCAVFKGAGATGGQSGEPTTCASSDRIMVKTIKKIRVKTSDNDDLITEGQKAVWQVQVRYL